MDAYVLCNVGWKQRREQRAQNGLEREVFPEGTVELALEDAFTTQMWVCDPKVERQKEMLVHVFLYWEG